MGGSELPHDGVHHRCVWTAGAISRADGQGVVHALQSSYVIEATDAAGNTARSGRHTVRVL